jgi:hypothetical protein
VVSGAVVSKCRGSRLAEKEGKEGKEGSAEGGEGGVGGVGGGGGGRVVGWRGGEVAGGGGGRGWAWLALRFVSPSSPLVST